jgi:membrane protein DedA with SNARE-associated domain
MENIEAFLDLYGLMAIFGIMLAKSAGVPIPVPADALMLATSARIATGKIILGQAFAVILTALIAGGMIQYALVRGPGRRFLYRYGRYLGLTPQRLDAAAHRLQKAGTVGIGIAVLTPGVRSVAVAGSGLAGVPIRRFIPGLTLGSSLFLGLHFFLGFVGGALLTGLGNIISLPVVIVGVVIVLVAGLGVWVIIRRRQLPAASNREVFAEAVGAWHEAVCPVCLTLGAVERLQLHDHDHILREELVHEHL